MKRYEVTVDEMSSFCMEAGSRASCRLVTLERYEVTVNEFILHGGRVKGFMQMGHYENVRGHNR
jgi:hypothetical protein